MGNLATPKSVQKLQTALHAKAKAEASYRFYALYDKINRDDILAHAYAQCRSNAAAGRNPRSSHPAVAAFPDSAVGSACTSTFSRLAWRSLALRPAHSRGHQVVTAIRRLQPFRYLHDCSDCFRLERSAGWALHPLESAAFSRRTPIAVIPGTRFNCRVRL